VDEVETDDSGAYELNFEDDYCLCSYFVLARASPSAPACERSDRYDVSQDIEIQNVDIEMVCEEADP